MCKRPLCITLEMQKLLQHEKTTRSKVNRVWSTPVGYVVSKDTRGKGLRLSNAATGFYSLFFREVSSQTQLPELPEYSSTLKLKKPSKCKVPATRCAAHPAEERLC